jgi:hypothetical protein
VEGIVCFRGNWKKGSIKLRVSRKGLCLVTGQCQRGLKFVVKISETGISGYELCDLVSISGRCMEVLTS